MKETSLMDKPRIFWISLLLSSSSLLTLMHIILIGLEEQPNPLAAAE